MKGIKKIIKQTSQVNNQYGTQTGSRNCCWDLRTNFYRHLLTNGDLSSRSYLNVFRVKTQQKQKEMK